MSTEKAATLKIGPVEGVDDLFEVSPTAVRKLQTDEIVIGLCAPAGSPVHRVAEDLGLAVQLDPRQVHPVASGMLESVPALEGLVVQSLVSRKILEG